MFVTSRDKTVSAPPSASPVTTWITRNGFSDAASSLGIIAARFRNAAGTAGA
jgi:hypothetical protein